MSEDVGTFGPRLRARRRAAGLSQQELAERSGLSIRAISNLERGQTQRPYRDSLHRLADSLKLRDSARDEFIEAGSHWTQAASANGVSVFGAGVDTGADDAEAGTDSAAARGPAIVPRQLPAPVSAFVGREDQLVELSRILDRPSGSSPIAMISGTAGVGKTALAAQWSHRSAELFPDGQLYVNLHGYDAGPPKAPAEALAGFLRALGTADTGIPAETDERAAAYRSILATRRILVMLDNARDAEQVRPLLPGAPGCAVVVTSRDALPGLVARDGAERLELDLLPRSGAIALLQLLIGARVDEEPFAAGILADQCCRLPLALRISAELALSRPTAELAELCAELADSKLRLDALNAGGDESTEVRAVLSWSYRRLTVDQARAFRLVALYPGGDFDLHAAAALADRDPRQARHLVDALARAYLVHSVGGDRYGMHDLLRGFGRELANAEDDGEAARAATARLLDYYLHTASAAMDVLFPAESGHRPRLGAPSAAIAPVAEPGAARAWLDAERANLIAAISDAAGQSTAEVTAEPITHAAPAQATELAATVQRYLSFGHHLNDSTSVHINALHVARRGGDRVAEATALTHLGFAEWGRSRYPQAADYQRQALALFRAAGDRLGQARALHRLALVEQHSGRFDAAIGNAEQVLALSRQAGDRLGQARALHSLGCSYRARGRYTEAVGFLRQSLALSAELGDQRGRSVTVKEFGVIELRFDRLTSAAEYFRRALALCRATGNRGGQAEAVSQLGLVHLRHGRYRQATRAQERALAIYRAMDDLHGEGQALTRFARTELDAGQLQRASVHLTQALDLSRRIGARPVETVALNGLGEAARLGGYQDLACGRYEAALDLTGQTGDLDERARAHHGLALAHAALGHPEEAQRHAREALAGYTDLGVPEAEEVRTRFGSMVIETVIETGLETELAVAVAVVTAG